MPPAIQRARDVLEEAITAPATRRSFSRGYTVSYLLSSTLMLSLAVLAPGKNLPDLAPPAGVEIEGYYTCNGKDANHEPYSGVVVIARRGDVYVVGWQIESNTSVGVGLRQGMCSVSASAPHRACSACAAIPSKWPRASRS